MSQVTECGACRGSGVAQYLLDDSGCPCGPLYPCSECEGTGERTGELVDYDAFVYGAREGEHDTIPAPGPHECETLPAPAIRTCGIPACRAEARSDSTGVCDEHYIAIVGAVS